MIIHKLPADPVNIANQNENDALKPTAVIPGPPAEEKLVLTEGTERSYCYYWLDGTFPVVEKTSVPGEYAKPIHCNSAANKIDYNKAKTVI